MGGSASSGAAGSGDKALVTSADLEASEIHKGGDMWSPEEDAALVEGVRKHGLSWTTIAKTLPGRSPGASRNRYTRTLVKRAPVKACGQPRSRRRKQRRRQRPPLPWRRRRRLAWCCGRWRSRMCRCRTWC